MPACINTRGTPAFAQTAGKEDRTSLTSEVSELWMQRCRTHYTKFPPVGEQEIKSLKVMCSSSENGCGWVGELRTLDDHLTTCAYALLRCTNECMEKGSEVKILRHELEQHLRKCPNRQHQCPHCQDTGRYCDITTTHLDTCPKLEVPCPNSECTVSVVRCKLSYHRSKCPFEEMTCKYAGISCKEKLPRKDLEQHENDDSFHLHLAMETVIEQQVKEKPCIFKMPEFEQHKSSQDFWYSPPFYTCPGGYKMCIGIDANGDSDAAGTHVSVFAYLRKGRNDDNLPWPFPEEVTITLLNQLADNNHYTNTVSFPQDDEASRRVVDDERAPGYGYPKFIKHSQLEPYYLKDDCLYFRIEVTPPKPPKPWLTCTVKDYAMGSPQS